MMSKVIEQLSRRNLLKYLSRSILYYPVLRSFHETEVFGAENAPRRAVFFFFPSGIIDEVEPLRKLCVKSEFHPNSGPLSTLPSMTKPLERVKNDIIIIRNSVYATGGSHEGGMRYALTGSPNAVAAPSIDSILGEKFKAGIPVVRLGVRSQFEGGADSQSCSFNLDSKLAVRWDNPSYAFNQLFGGSAPTTPTTPNAPSMPTSGLSLSSKKSLLDSNRENLASIQKKLGKIEKDKLDSHLSAIRELERRIQMTSGGGNTGGGGNGDTVSGQCSRKINFTKTFDANDLNSYDGPYKTVENFDAVADMQSEIAVQALACRITNVVLLQHGFSVFEMGFTGGRPAKGGRGHHSNGHYNAEGSVQDHVADQQYMMTKLANLIENMGKIKEGDKSLLYNSTMMAFSELGDSAAHRMENVPVIIAGQGGGYFKTGRCVDADGTAHTKTLVSIYESFGLKGQSIGTDKDGKPMPGLTG